MRIFLQQHAKVSNILRLQRMWSRVPTMVWQCPACGTYNSKKSSSNRLPRVGEVCTNRPTAKHGQQPNRERRSRLRAITNRDQARWFSGHEELDRVLGGGIVPGSLVLIGVIQELANQHCCSRSRIDWLNSTALYVCGGRSASEAKSFSLGV